MVIDAIFIVLSVFLMIGVGMLLTKLGWIDKSGGKLLSNLVIKVGMPATVVHKMFTSFTKASLLESASGIIAPFVSICITLLAGYGLARLLRLPKARRGVFTCMFSFANTVFIGMPVTTALFGEESTPYALLYYLANTVFFWSIGYIMMSRDGGNEKVRIDWKKMIPVPLVTLIISVIGILLNIQLPSFVLSAAKYLSGIVTPVSLIYSGWIIMNMILSKKVRWEKGYLCVLLGRFLAAPLLLLVTSKIFPMPSLMRNALLIQASMPVMAQTPIVAGGVGADAEYAAGGIAISTFCSLLTIPAYMALIPLL